MYAFSASAQYVGQYRGDFLGIAVPVGSCSNERRTMNVIAEDNGDVHGTIFDWEAGAITSFQARMFSSKVNCTTGDVFDPEWNPPDPANGWLVKMKVSARGGTMRGTIDARSKGGCKYTFTLHRQFKLPQ